MFACSHCYCEHVQLRMLLVLQAFGHQPKYWTFKKFDLMMASDKMSGYPESYYYSLQKCLQVIFLQIKSEVFGHL